MLSMIWAGVDGLAPALPRNVAGASPRATRPGDVATPGAPRALAPTSPRTELARPPSCARPGAEPEMTDGVFSAGCPVPPGPLGPPLCSLAPGRPCGAPVPGVPSPDGVVTAGGNDA